MHIAKGLSLAAAAATLLLCGPAPAQQPTDLRGSQALPPQEMPLAGNKTIVGIGVICDTSEQAEQFVDLRAQGQDIQPAMHIVNRKAKRSRACGIAAIAFIRGKTLDSKAVNGKLVQIVRINVVAGYNGVGWNQIANTTQYAVIETKGLAI